MRQQWVLLARLQPEKATKAPRVVEAEAVAIIEHQINMVMAPPLRIAGDHAQRARHTQMHQCRPRSRMEQQVFAPTLDRLYTLPGQ
jgi:hypothetical protein